MGDISREADEQFAGERYDRDASSDGRATRHRNVDVVFRFAHDSPLEGDGFEPSVPRQIFSAARTCTIEPRALRQAEQWINARRIEWEHRLDGLGEYLKTLETKGDCDGSGD